MSASVPLLKHKQALHGHRVMSPNGPTRAPDETTSLALRPAVRTRSSGIGDPRIGAAAPACQRLEYQSAPAET